MSTQAQPQPFSFIEYPKFVETWVLIVVGFVLCFLHWAFPAEITERNVGIVWLSVLVFTMVAMGLDFDVTGGTILFLIVSFLFTFFLLIAKQYSVPVFHGIAKSIGLIDFSMKSHVVMTISLVLGFVWILMWCWCHINHKWVVRPGKLERHVFGRATEEVVISPERRVNYDIPDLMDSMLTFGGGFLVTQLDESGHTKRIGIVFKVRKLDNRIDQFERLPISPP